MTTNYGKMLFPNAEVSEIIRFENILWTFMRSLSKGLFNKFSAKKAEEYFKAYASYGMLHTQTFEFVAVVAFMAAVYDGAAEAFPEGRGRNDPFWVETHDTLRLLVDGLLPTLQTDARGAVFLNIHKLAYLIKPTV